jgi:hypothetical protein
VKDALVVAFIIFECFLCQYFCILLSIQRVIVEGAFEVEGGLHDSRAKVFVCSGNHKFAIFFQLI